MNAYKESQVVLASAARTATTTGTFATGCLGGIFIINVTAVVSSPSVVFTIKGQDPASGATWDILASSAITGTGTTVLRIHPELSASANAIAKDVLPMALKVVATHGNANSITYSVGFVGVQ